MIQPSHFLVFNQRNWKCISITKIYSQVFTIALFMIAKLWKQRRCLLVQFSSVAQLCPTLRAHGLQHARLPCPSPTPGACSNSCPLNRWCHPTISSSVVPFSSCFQSFPASGSFPMGQFFASGDQSIWVEYAQVIVCAQGVGNSIFESQLKVINKISPSKKEISFF